MEKSKIEDQMNHAFINWSQGSNKDDPGAVKTGATVPEILGDENCLFSSNGGGDFERMQKEVPSYHLYSIQ